MLFFSFLGTEYFYLLIMPALLWCVDARLGVRLGILFLLSASFNSILKLVFHAPRPFWLERKAGGFEFESSFGIPSGHAQNSMAVWGFLAAKQRVGKVWAAVIIFLIGLSRLYLGVHFPTDVLAGWVIGGALLWAFLRYEDAGAAWLKQRRLGQQILVALCASLALIAIDLMILFLLRDWHLPNNWNQNMIAVAGNRTIPAILVPEGVVRPAGALLGFAAGAAWLSAQSGLNPQGTATQRVQRYFLGITGVVIIWFGLGHVFPKGDTFISYTCLYLRYALLGLWISALAPLLFMRLKLAQPAHPALHNTKEPLAT